MTDNETTSTLLHALLRNQRALADALHGIADWLDEQDETNHATAVRDQLSQLDDNRMIIGECIKELMRSA